MPTNISQVPSKDYKECNALEKKGRKNTFSDCLRVMNTKAKTDFLESCAYNVHYAAATDATGRRKAVCDTLAVFAEQCLNDYNIFVPGWRDTRKCGIIYI